MSEVALETCAVPSDLSTNLTPAGIDSAREWNPVVIVILESRSFIENFVNNRKQLTFFVRPEGYFLCSVRAIAEACEHLPPGVRELDRALDFGRRQRHQRRVII